MYITTKRISKKNMFVIKLMGWKNKVSEVNTKKYRPGLNMFIRILTESVILRYYLLVYLLLLHL